MKFTVATPELKNVFKLVNTLLDCSRGSKINAHEICLINANPKEKKLRIEFSVNDSYMTYDFREVMFDTKDENKGEGKRVIDFESLSKLSLGGKTVTIGIFDNNKENYISFDSGKLKGKLFVNRPDMEQHLEEIKPEEIELDHTFSIEHWLNVLDKHLYGFHNSKEAERRAVHIQYKDGNIIFSSLDSISAGLTTLLPAKPVTEEIDWYIVPEPLKKVLSALPKDIDESFYFGMGKNNWFLNHNNTKIWFPNIVKFCEVDNTKLANQINTNPCFSVSVSGNLLKEALDELNPICTTLVDKDDGMPTVVLKVNFDSKEASFVVNNRKVKDAEVVLEKAELTDYEDKFTGEQRVCINFKFLSEFVSSLLEKDKNHKKDSNIYIKWWPKEKKYSPEGKNLLKWWLGVCIGKDENNMFVVARVREEK